MVADQAFSAFDFLTRMQSLRQPITCISRLRLDARLFGPPPDRTPHRAGRPRLVGRRLPTLQQALHAQDTAWTKLTVPHWYGAVAREIEYTSGTAIWYHGGFPPLPIAWVLIRDPLASFDSLALLCTDPKQLPHQILGACRNEKSDNILRSENRMAPSEIARFFDRPGQDGWLKCGGGGRFCGLPGLLGDFQAG